MLGKKASNLKYIKIIGIPIVIFLIPFLYWIYLVNLPYFSTLNLNRVTSELGAIEVKFPDNSWVPLYLQEDPDTPEELSNVFMVYASSKPERVPPFAKFEVDSKGKVLSKNIIEEIPMNYLMDINNTLASRKRQEWPSLDLGGRLKYNYVCEKSCFPDGGCCGSKSIIQADSERAIFEGYSLRQYALLSSGKVAIILGLGDPSRSARDNRLYIF